LEGKAVWQYATHTNNPLPSPSCSTTAKENVYLLMKNIGEFSPKRNVGESSPKKVRRMGH